MAATVKRQMWAYSSSGNVPFPRRPLQIAASQGLLIPGTPMYMSQAGTLKVCDTSDGTDLVSYMLDTKITTELSALDEVYGIEVNQDQLWCVYLETSDADTAAVQSYVGEEYGLTIATGSGKVGYATLAIDNANPTCRVIDILPNREPERVTTSTSPGVAIVRFTASVLTGEKA
ncbi:MAG: hypothetical protein GY851_00355 [bacterium]|nr:hypothetical protein [bacterium]